MFSTLKTKIFFLVTLIMASTAAGIMYFTHRDVGKAMLASERASSQNILRLVELNIKGGYEKLLSEKFDLVVSSRKRLKEVLSLSVSVLDANAKLVDDGLLAREEAKRRSLNWIKSAHAQKGNLFVFDQTGIIISHPDSSFEGRSMTALMDIKDRKIHEVMREDVLNSGGDFAVFYWKDSNGAARRKKLGFFAPFHRWKWTLCAILDFEDIEAQAQKKMDKIIEVLKSTFENIQIAKTGYAFLFNGNGDMLIPPKNPADADYKTLLNIQTGNLLLDDLKMTAQKDAVPIHYAIASSEGSFAIEAKVIYFKAFDWYLAVAVPVQEIHEPANALVTRQSAVILIIFLISLIAAYFLMSRISRPLKRLAAYAKEIPLQDFTSDSAGIIAPDDLPIKSDDEVGHLAESFMMMKAKLRKNIQEVIETQAKYRAILESIEEGFFETDLKGRLTFFNHCICSMIGYEKEELVGKHCRRYMTMATFRDVYDVFNKVYQTGTPLEIRNCAILRKTGEKKSFELSIYLVKDQTGQPIGFRGVARDISERLKAEEERKNLESQLMRSQKMEALGTLAGGIAHDFNNVLTAVIGYTELVLSEHADGSRPHKNLNEVIKAAFRARDLVNQILTFSRQTEQELKPVMIGPIVKETLTFLKATIPPSIEIRKSINTKLDIVFSDPTQIHQVVMNLCTNAAHAMWDKGGVLDVLLTMTELDSMHASYYPDLSPGRYLKLSVKDTGHGMDQDTQDRIFDPYFTTKEKGKGTGLGLAVTLGIVESHGGTITVSSQPNKGTTFEVYYPLAEESVAEEIRNTDPLPMGEGRVLLIDDEEPILDMAEQMLEGLGYEVVVHQSTGEALEQFKEDPNRFDLVITDHIMPKMTGLELASELKTIRSDVPIIICSGNGDQHLKKKIKKKGIQKFLPKPLVMRDLADTIREVLNS